MIISKRNQLFKNLLSYFWLRPEKALLHTLKAESFRKTLKYFKGKKADISCGDGIFSFFALGGELNIDSDQYQSLNISKYKNSKVDVYNHYNSKYFINIKKNQNYLMILELIIKSIYYQKQNILKFIKNLYYITTKKILKINLILWILFIQIVLTG